MADGALIPGGSPRQLGALSDYDLCGGRDLRALRQEHGPADDGENHQRGPPGLQPGHAGAAGGPAEAEPPHGEPPGGHLL